MPLCSMVAGPKPVNILQTAAAVLTSLTVVTSPVRAANGGSDPGSSLMALTIVLVVVVGYFLPTVIAFSRRHPNRWVILLINVVFGATGLGWFGALIWAFRAVHISPTGNHGGESGLNIAANDPVHIRIEPSLDGSRSIADRLRELASLHADGLIDEGEYRRLRGQMLEQLRP